MVANTGRPDAATKVRSTLQAICGISDQLSSARSAGPRGDARVLSGRQHDRLTKQAQGHPGKAAEDLQRQAMRIERRIRAPRGAFAQLRCDQRGDCGGPRKAETIRPNSAVDRLAAASAWSPAARRSHVDRA